MNYTTKTYTFTGHKLHKIINVTCNTNLQGVSHANITINNVSIHSFYLRFISIRFLFKSNAFICCSFTQNDRIK